jgi:tetratricopeptide (TPR) repeat protein
VDPNGTFQNPSGIDGAILDDCTVQARILNDAGHYRLVLDRFEPYVERALQARYPGLLHQVGVAGSVLPDTAAHERALELLNAAVTCLHPEEDSAQLSLVLADLALLYLICGESDAARCAYVRAQIGAGSDPFSTARLNRMCTQFKPPQEATRCLLAMVELDRPENPRERACSLNNLGVSLRRTRETGWSRHWLSKALQAFREQGGDCSDVPLNNLGCLDADQDDFDSAEKHFRDAQVRIGDCSAAILVESNLAGILFARKQYEECRVRLERLLPRAESTGDPLYTTIVSQNLARARVTQREPQAALDLLQPQVGIPLLAEDPLFRQARAALQENARYQRRRSAKEIRPFSGVPEARLYWPWIFAPIEIL